MVQQQRRLISLDAMRGFTIAAMIVANFPGREEAVYFTLRHSRWNGLSVTDLVAPFFLFIVGVSIVFAYSRRLAEQDSRRELYQKIVIRSLKIFAVGMFLNLMPGFDFAEVRWTGTLHRIALVFGICALLFLRTTWKQQLWIGVIILVGYWLAMTRIPTPDVGRVVLEPGQNLAAWVDRKYLPGRMWQRNWDPEGILSTFPSIVTGIVGMLAGRWLIKTNVAPRTKATYLIRAGLVSLFVGYGWHLFFPINENLWTSSFVVVTAGLAALLLGLMYLFVDILGYTSWTRPGVIFGANAIAVYVLADIFALFFYGFQIGNQPLNAYVTGVLIQLGIAPKLSSLLYALFFVGVNFVPAYILYRKRIFIKL